MEKYLIGTHIEAYPYEETCLSIYNKNTGKTYVLGERESQVFLLLNGANTVEDIQRACPFFSFGEIEKLMVAFAEIGLFDTQKKRFNPLKVKLRLFNPNRIIKENHIVTRSFHHLITICCPLLLLTGVLMMQFTSVASEITVNQILGSFSSLTVVDGIAIALLSVLCLSIHEFAHMITARRYGVNVPEVGVMLYFLIPCAYTNISGINLLKSKRKRLIVLMSGSLVNFGIIGVCYIFIALFPTIQNMMYGISIVILNLGTLFMNTMVFLKFDGYYILETILEEPGLREKALAHLRKYIGFLFSKTGSEKQGFRDILKDESSFLRHIIYVTYAVLSIIYIPIVLLQTVLPFFR